MREKEAVEKHFVWNVLGRIGIATRLYNLRIDPFLWNLGSLWRATSVLRQYQRYYRAADSAILCFSCHFSFRRIWSNTVGGVYTSAYRRHTGADLACLFRFIEKAAFLLSSRKGIFRRLLHRQCRHTPHPNGNSFSCMYVIP
jgi:hypothetical protein